MSLYLSHSGTDPETQKPVESYAQIVYGDTKRIGCAASFFLDKTRYKRIAVSNYGPGLVIGLPLYGPGIPCYKAKQCDDGLVVA